MILLIAITLLFCINACEKEIENKGRVKKNIPECVKEKIKHDLGIATAEEYCNEDGTKKIYYLIYTKDSLKGFPPPPLSYVYAEDCDGLFVQMADNPIIFVLGDGTIMNTPVATLYPNGTMEYKGDIYYFKRTVFTQRNKKGGQE